MGQLKTRPPQILFLFALLLFAPAPFSLRAEQPSPAAEAQFDAFARALEARLNQQHQSPSAFVAGVANPQIAARLRNGQLIIEKRTPANASFAGALLHDWRGTAFIPGATAADFERLMRDYTAYPRVYAPEIVSSRVLSHYSNDYQVELRLRQKHVITVVLDTDYNVTFGEFDARHLDCLSRSTRVVEIAKPGTPQEHPLSPSQEHGFLWRINIYWSCVQQDGGIYIQIESVTHTRAIPVGLGWALQPFLENVPRESIEFTLNATRQALQP